MAGAARIGHGRGGNIVGGGGATTPALDLAQPPVATLADLQAMPIGNLKPGQSHLIGDTMYSWQPSATGGIAPDDKGGTAGFWIAIGGAATPTANAPRFHTADFTGQLNTIDAIDTSAPRTVTPPPSPSPNDWWKCADGTGDAAADNATIIDFGLAGQKYLSGDNNQFALNAPGATATFWWVNAAVGWTLER